MRERAYKKYNYKQREKRFFRALEEIKQLKLRKRLKFAYCILFKKELKTTEEWEALFDKIVGAE